MCGHQDCGSKALAQVAQVLPNGVTGQRIKPDCRFIQEKNLWPVQHGLSNLQTANHSPGIVAHQNLPGLAQSHEIQRVQHARLSLALWDSVNAGE